ncbi:MAG: OmpA family protein [Thiotrichales bacterium]|nr:MAG: OmpA family protein [Thiotrichales bacterium]
MKTYKYIVISLSLVLLSACVSSGKYEEAVTETDNMRNSLKVTQEELSASEAEIDKMRNSLGNTQEELSLSQAELDKLRETLGITQDELSASKAEIAMLSKIEAETKRRNEIYAQFVDRLQSMIDGGQLTVSIDAGRIVINLPNNVLFNSGSANLNAEGQEALAQIGGVLKNFSDRRFQVEGHTDNVPIKSARFPSNWELSTSRALAVVHLLTDMGVTPENLSAAGFGEFRPRADNESDEGRKLNRRIEIVMLPNLDILSSELPKVAYQ